MQKIRFLMTSCVITIIVIGVIAILNKNVQIATSYMIPALSLNAISMTMHSYFNKINYINLFRIIAVLIFVVGIIAMFLKINQPYLLILQLTSAALMLISVFWTSKYQEQEA